MKTTFILPCCLFLVTPNISCASSIKYSGFLNLTGGAVIESSDKYLSHAGYNKDFHFDQHSLMGLQAEFKSSDKLDELPQVISTSSSVEVLPFWVDDLSQGTEFGITRFDYSVTQ